MKNTGLFLAVSLVIGSSAIASELDRSAAMAEAKSIAQQLGGALQKELVGAMQTGGPVNALQVCNIDAMPITSAISEKNQAKVSRVSLKNRNPENVPNEWQQLVLQDFEKRAVAGEPVDAMASTEFVESDGKTQMRFMKALPASGACLTCHGQEITDELQAKLSELYPDDNATGYSLGDIRGAIVVTKDYQH